MNEKIKQLAEQAEFYYNPANQGSARQLEKFAQLIIEECADLFPHTFTDEHYQRRIDKTIRKHFGVIE